MLVLKSTFDTEHAARIRAESELKTAKSDLVHAEDLLVAEAQRRITAEAVAVRLEDTIQLLIEESKADRIAHAAQVSGLLTHLAPLKTEAAISLDDPALHVMTADEIAAIPASTSRERALRDRRVQEARERERGEEEKRLRKERMDLVVTEDERRLHALDFDSTLGILTEKVEVATPVEDAA